MDVQYIYERAEIDAEVQHTEPMDVDTEDGDTVEMNDISLTLHQQPSQISGKKVSVEGIVKACLQSALSKVKDKRENHERETERVKILMQCWQTSKSGVNGNEELNVLHLFF